MRPVGTVHGKQLGRGNTEPQISDYQRRPSRRESSAPNALRTRTAAFHAHAPVQNRAGIEGPVWPRAAPKFASALAAPHASPPACTGTRLPKAARHARRVPKASQGIGEAG